MRDEITDRLRIAGNDREKFVELHTLNRLVDQKRFCQKSQNRAKPGQRVKNKEGYDNNDQIRGQQCCRNIHR